MDIRLDDIIRLRKKHPCGEDRWQVVRLGSETKLKCLKCNRHVLLPRSVLERRVKALISRGRAAEVYDSENHPERK